MGSLPESATFLVFAMPTCLALLSAHICCASITYRSYVPVRMSPERLIQEPLCRLRSSAKDSLVSSCHAEVTCCLHTVRSPWTLQPIPKASASGSTSMPPSPHLHLSSVLSVANGSMQCFLPEIFLPIRLIPTLHFWIIFGGFAL